MRVLGLGSGTFRAFHRPEAPSFGVFWRPERVRANREGRLRGLNRPGEVSKNIVSYGNKLLGFKLGPKTGRRIAVTPLALAEAYLHEITNNISKH